jgi:hypothetical protein
MMNSWGDLLRQLLPKRHDAVQLRGFTVVVENTRPDIATSDVLERLDDALELVERHQPWRLRHLRRDLREIRVLRYPCRGAYFPAERACMVELTFLARRDIGPATVSSTIVHEGMHARVHAMGCGLWALAPELIAQSPERVSEARAREERICRRAELEFGESLPPDVGAPVVERALASLQLDDDGVAPEIDWEEALRRQNAIDSGHQR